MAGLHRLVFKGSREAPSHEVTGRLDAMSFFVVVAAAAAAAATFCRSPSRPGLDALPTLGRDAQRSQPIRQTACASHILIKPWPFRFLSFSKGELRRSRFGPTRPRSSAAPPLRPCAVVASKVLFQGFTTRPSQTALRPPGLFTRPLLEDPRARGFLIQKTQKREFPCGIRCWFGHVPRVRGFHGNDRRSSCCSTWSYPPSAPGIIRPVSSAHVSPPRTPRTGESSPPFHHHMVVLLRSAEGLKWHNGLVMG